MKVSMRAMLIAVGIGLAPVSAVAVPVVFTELPGLTGGSPAQTVVFKSALSSIGLGSILSITISDNSAGIGGSPGQFSGFDLDAIKLSLSDCADAACAAAAPGLGVFDFITGVVFTPGTQRPVADAKLFGSGVTGNTLDDTVATLSLFDGDSSIVTPDGFISLGDGGSISFNLTAATSTEGLFLYIGEVGNNGEVAASNIEVRSSRVSVPGTLALLGIGITGFVLRKHRRF
jgi:hypothetical protein